MEFNASRCEVLTVTIKRSPIVNNYILHGQALKYVKSAKCSGITIANDLKWNNQANKTPGFVKRNGRTRQTPIKTKAYQALVSRPTAHVCGIHILRGEYGSFNLPNADQPDTVSIDSIFESRWPICIVSATPRPIGPIYGHDSISCRGLPCIFHFFKKKLEKEKIVMTHTHAWPPSSILKFGQ